MTEIEPTKVYLGVHAGSRSVAVCSSNGGRTSITSERLSGPEDWMELTTYGLHLPSPAALYACVAVSSGTSHERRQAIVRAGRDAGWDAIMVVNAVRAAAHGLDRDGLQAVVVVDGERSSVGICEGSRLQAHDHVSAVPGREARELAVSLRCLLKARPREDQRALVRALVIAGDKDEIERVGRRRYEDELAALGAHDLSFELDPYLLARGAERIATSTERIQWRRLRRAQR
ncbi:MAG: hypothetical protein AB7N76_11655 [Planctomycetota bacterium]